MPNDWITRPAIYEPATPSQSQDDFDESLMSGWLDNSDNPEFLAALPPPDPAMARLHALNMEVNFGIDPVPASEQHRVRHGEAISPLFRIFTSESMSHDEAAAIPKVCSSGSEAKFSSPFELPLRSDQHKATNSANDSSNAPASWRELRLSYLARLKKPRLEESKFDQRSRVECVDAWKEIIRNKQRANPKWMTQWLESYGSQALQILSDTQLAALLDVPLHRLHRGCLSRRYLDRLVDVKLSPARLALQHRAKKVRPRRSQRTKGPWARFHSVHKTWTEYQPTRTSSLRTLEYSEGNIARNWPGLSEPQSDSSLDSAGGSAMVVEADPDCEMDQNAEPTHMSRSELDLELEKAVEMLASLSLDDPQATTEDSHCGGMPIFPGQEAWFDDASDNSSVTSSGSESSLFDDEQAHSMGWYHEPTIIDDGRVTSESPLSCFSYAKNFDFGYDDNVYAGPPIRTRHLANSINRFASGYDDSEYQQDMARMKKLSDLGTNHTYGFGSSPQPNAVGDLQSLGFLPLPMAAGMDIPAQEATCAAYRGQGKRRRQEEYLDQPPTKRARLSPRSEKVSTFDVGASNVNSTPVKSPPRGPAALRAPPTGPAAARNFTAPAAPQAAPSPRHPPQGPSGPSRPGATSPTVPPAGPRGYVPLRGASFANRGGGRGSWSAGPARHSISGSSQAGSPTIPPAGPSSSNSIPTGPRAQSISSVSGSPSVASKPFNPPTGPSGHMTPHHQQRPTLAQNLMNTMPPIIPGGKIDPSALPIELDPHHRKLREEEERVREELRAKQEKLRKSLRIWDKLERESKGFELKSDLSERSLKNIAGEGLGGAAF
ncbi:hypothetical protein C8A00DRAFT_38022 [Chaetomidium leptoderma]|uniref:Uncharacterized protein n=1 Tax=Chaetomidium leptoderma TaxID=669021 RepID=A0AAN6VDL3_9PEZI|nr:hypothetical protein C8A00DRAFT_38022 [Chaetomidium leptoderma]